MVFESSTIYHDGMRDERTAWAFRVTRPVDAARPEWVQAVWKHREIAVVADSARGEAALESRSLGLWGFGDASVHRWRRSDAADAATEQSGGLYQRGEPGSGDRGLHRRTGPCRLGICRDDAGG